MLICEIIVVFIVNLRRNEKTVQLQRKNVIQEWMHETYNASRSYVTSNYPTPALIREQWPAFDIRRGK